MPAHSRHARKFEISQIPQTSKQHKIGKIIKSIEFDVDLGFNVLQLRNYFCRRDFLSVWGLGLPCCLVRPDDKSAQSLTIPG